MQARLRRPLHPPLVAAAGAAFAAAGVASALTADGAVHGREQARRPKVLPESVVPRQDHQLRAALLRLQDLRGDLRLLPPAALAAAAPVAAAAIAAAAIAAAISADAAAAIPAALAQASLRDAD